MIVLATSLVDLLPAEVGAEVRAVAAQLRVEPDALVVEMITGMLALGRGAHRDCPPRSVSVPTLTPMSEPQSERILTIREQRAATAPFTLKRSA